MQGLYDFFACRVSSSRIVDVAEKLYATDRWFDFQHFRRTAEFVLERLRSLGLEAEVREYAADGRTLHGDWRMPLAWDVDSALLALLPSGEVLADYEKLPCSLCMWSGPTPEDGVKVPLVMVENGARESDYERTNVRGKAIFTRAHPHNVKAMAARHGALGIVSCYVHGADRHPDAVVWANAWSDDPGGWAMTAGDSRIWGFNVSPRTGERLEQRLRAGEVQVHATVRSRLYEGTLPIITGRICGKELPDEEVVVLGHLFEQGAVDNAAGGAAMLDVARVLQESIRRGEIAPPRRSIRFLFTSECYGTYAYLDDVVGLWAGREEEVPGALPSERRASARGPRMVAGFCVDSTGMPSRDEEGAGIRVSFNPHANFSFADALALDLIRKHWPRESWLPAPFSATDNLIADPAIGTPCVWAAAANPHWHTSADTLDTIVPERHAKIAGLVATYAYVIANAGDAEAAQLADKLGALYREDLSRLQEQGAPAAYVDYFRSCAAIAARDKLVSRYFSEELRDEELRDTEPAPGASSNALHRVPKRLCKTTITFDRLSEKEREGRPSPRWSSRWMNMLFWCNGCRTIEEIAELLRWSECPFPHEGGAPPRDIPSLDEKLREDFDFLARKGYVAF